MSIGNKIKTHREKIHITQKELSERSGLSRNYIALIETNKKNPSINSLNKIAESLGVSPYILIQSDEDILKLRRNIINQYKDEEKLNRIVRSIEI